MPRKVDISISVLQGINLGSERLSHLPQVTQLFGSGNGRKGANVS